MSYMPVPSLTSEDALPFSAIQLSAVSDFIVFDKGINPQGGKEYLRLLFSQEGGRFFSEVTKAPSVVIGASDGLDLGSAFASVQTAIDAAGADTFIARWPKFYADMDETSQTLLSELMTGQITPDEMIEQMQALADQIREDDSIPKITLEAPATASPVATPAS